MILFWLVLIIYGLLIHPYFFQGDRFSIEVIVLISVLFNCFYLLRIGFSWESIQASIKEKIAETIPIILILISIGALIGSWVISGVIPMLTYYGLNIIQPHFIYVSAFIICSLFSILTGTSWGTVGTIGVVMISIATAFNVNLGICAGAIISGAVFGDKLSPLSDTTNLTALAAGVDLMGHVKSMAYSIVPSAIIAAVIFWWLCPAVDADTNLASILAVKTDLKETFSFSFLLLLPVFVVIFGAVKRYPIFLVLTSAAVLAMILALFVQNFSAASIFTAVKSGFSESMINTNYTFQSNIAKILSTGGITSLLTPMLVAILFFAYLGTLNVVNALENLVIPITKEIKGTSTTVISSIISTTLFHALVTSMYAAIFLTAETFKAKYDKLGIDRSVLSRSIEDGGTLISPLIPWTPTCLFMMATLGVSYSEFYSWHLLAYVNYIIAVIFAVFGIAMFKSDSLPKNNKT